MSDCRKFGTSELEDKSIEERIAILEQKIPVLIERIQAYDKIIIENEDLKKKLNNLETKVDHSHTMLQASISPLGERQKDLESDLGSLKKVLELTQINSDTHTRNYEFIGAALKSYIKKNDDFILGVETSISRIPSDYARLQDLSSLKDTLKSCVSRINNELSNLAYLQQKDQSKFDNISTIEKKFAEEVIGLKLYIGKLNDKIETSKDKNDKSFDGLMARMNDLPDKIIEQVNAVVEQARNEMIPKGSTIKDVRNEFYAKLDSFRMDLSNTILKSSVTSQQIAAMEKKSEQIYLLLQKYDLDQLV